MQVEGVILRPESFKLDTKGQRSNVTLERSTRVFCVCLNLISKTFLHCAASLWIMTR